MSWQGGFPQCPLPEKETRQSAESKENAMTITPLRSGFEMLATLAASLVMQAGFYALCLTTLG